MGKILLVACIMCLMALMNGAFAASTSGDKVNIVVAGYINHGPLQPTVDAIKDVISKHGDKLNVEWIDLTTDEGQKYFQDHGLTAHMNVLINGKYKYKVDGKDVDFEWFEGQNWNKNDLDTVINDVLSNNGKAVPIS
jgi:hypothetical protein